MEFWDKVQKDISKSFKDGIDVIKVKSTELTDEGKRRYKTYDIKSQIHKNMADLGATVYGLRKSKKNPLNEAKVTNLIKKISKMEDDLHKVESTGTKKKAKKKAVKKKAKKKAVKKKS